MRSNVKPFDLFLRQRILARQLRDFVAVYRKVIPTSPPD